MSHELNEYFDNIEIRGSKVKDNNSKKPNNKKKKLVTIITPKKPNSSLIIEKIKSVCGSGK